jgi:hypothetical protein
MLLDFLIWLNKRKLDRMITSNCTYDELLKQSQKLDMYINIWMKNWVRFKGKSTNKSTNKN